MRHSSSLQGNSELLLALTWTKKLSCNPNPGYSSSHKHTMKDSSNPQSQNRETQPTDWKSTVAQNKIEHHNQQKTWERQQLKNIISEHGSQHRKVTPNILCVRELAPDHKTQRKTYTRPQISKETYTQSLSVEMALAPENPE